MKIQFTVPGIPRPKERPRIGQGHAYTPEKTRKYEEEIWWMAHSAGARQDSLRGKFLKVLIIASVGWTVPDVLHCDGDNVLKVYLDAMKPAFNDAWVVDMRIVKQLGDPQCEVLIEEVQRRNIWNLKPEKTRSGEPKRSSTPSTP